MKILFLIVIGIAIAVIIKEIKKRNTNASETDIRHINSSNLNVKDIKQSSDNKVEKAKTIKPKFMHGKKTFQRKYAINNSFDDSFFKSEDGKFKFPRYKSEKENLVKIKDITPYSDFWKILDSKEKACFSIKDFDHHYDGDGMIEVQVDDFWDFMKKLKILNLKPYEYLKGHIDGLDYLIFYIEEKPEDVPYIYPKDHLEKTLFKNGILSTYEFKSEQEAHEYYKVHLNSLMVTELKELSKNAGLKPSLKKQELIDQLLANNIVNNLPKPYIKNEKFDEMINHFYDLYIKDIQNQIDKWHPYYIEAVWLEVQGNMTFPETSQLAIKINKIINEEYWAERITTENI